MKKLPLGIQTFEKLINRNCLYIDKTAQIYHLLDSGSVYILSRPRRFGKSLLVSTLKAIFQGKRELFRGLYIYDKICWEPHPVIHIDFSMMVHDTPENLEESIHLFLNREALKVDLQYTSTLLGEKFKELIEYLARDRQVVILVDEYDKAIIGSLPDAAKARANRNVLRNLFDPLKGLDPYLKFVFLTGVTKFSKVSIFSGLNNLEDLTIDPRSGTLLGITEEELGSCCAPWLEKLAAHEQLEPEALGDKIRNWYNGYSFDGKSRLYNPTSLFNLFTKLAFDNYWFATGTPTFLLEMIKEHKYNITEIENVEVGKHIHDSFDIEKIDIYALLLQTGYLTIRGQEQIGDESLFTLGYPNREVKKSLLHYIFSDYADTPVTRITPAYLKINRALAGKNMEEFITLLKSLFARIPSHLHLEHEFYYHSLFYMILSLMGAEIQLETLTDKGRIDAVLELEQIIYIIELKLGQAEPGMKQIKEKRYHESYLHCGKELMLLAVGGFKDRDIRYLLEPVNLAGEMRLF